MERRKVLQNIGLLTGGVLCLPYACDFSTEIYYSNFPLLKEEQQKLIGQICKILLPPDTENFPTPESQQHFVLTMINDCLTPEERISFTNGFESFRALNASEKNLLFQDLSAEEQQALIEPYVDVEEESENDLTLFMGYLKSYSLLHFETSENYLKNYLKFEFMPGRYFGSVAV